MPPRGVTEQLMTSGQSRVMFDGIPVDLFLDTTPFHSDLRLHLKEHQLADRKIPFLGCNDLAVFKAFFNRRKDWADIEEMVRADRLDVPYVVGLLVEYLGADDERIRELLARSRRTRRPSGSLTFSGSHGGRTYRDGSAFKMEGVFVIVGLRTLPAIRSTSCLRQQADSCSSVAVQIDQPRWR